MEKKIIAKPNIKQIFFEFIFYKFYSFVFYI